MLTGLANDGGLYVPAKLPVFSAEEIASWAGLGYAELAQKVILPFVEKDISADELKTMINATYDCFKHPAVAPLVQLGHNEWVHGIVPWPNPILQGFCVTIVRPFGGLYIGQA